MMVAAVVVAGGRGVRMAAAVRKQYILLAGLPILAHTLQIFDNCDPVDEIFLVVPQDDFQYCREHVLAPARLSTPITLVPGGRERQESVCNGLAAIEDEDAVVLIHDGVRPFVQPEQVLECIQAASRHGAAILAVPASDTLKQVNAAGAIEATLDRGCIWLAQTPQAFRCALIRKAHARAREAGIRGTDDAALVERLGIPVKIIQGGSQNIKITRSEDLPLAGAILASRARARR